MPTKPQYSQYSGYPTPLLQTPYNDYLTPSPMSSVWDGVVPDFAPPSPPSPPSAAPRHIRTRRERRARSPSPTDYQAQSITRAYWGPNNQYSCRGGEYYVLNINGRLNTPSARHSRPNSIPVQCQQPQTPRSERRVRFELSPAGPSLRMSVSREAPRGILKVGGARC